LAAWCEPDTEKRTDQDQKPEKHYFLAFGGVLLVNSTVNIWNRFVFKDEMSDVTWDYASHFYDHDWVWDTDCSWTNFYLHPYQGSLYYMSARGCGLNQFESLLYAAAGSAMWEYFGETTAPSRNDVIYTPSCGFALGEMLYRLSLEADEISRICGFLINPMRLYTEPVTGHRPYGSAGHIYDISLKFGIGTQLLHTSFSGSDSSDAKNEVFPVFVYPEFAVVYNDPYGWDSNIPFSQFELTEHSAVGKGSGSENGGHKDVMFDITLVSSGMLFSRAPDFGSDRDTTAGIGLDYDFIWQSSREFSDIAPGFIFKQRIRHEDGSKSEWQIHQNWVALGTSDYWYFLHNSIPKTETRRNYSFNTGSGTQLKYVYTTAGGCIIDTSIKFYALWDFPGQKQNNAHTGWEFIGFCTLNGEVPVSRHVNIGLANELYLKKSVYNGTFDVFHTAYTGSVFARLTTGR
jgi:hypothetical protein